jgi:hypothetical protein
MHKELKTKWIEALRGGAKGIVAKILLPFAAGGAIAAALIFGVPWLWRMIKPWLHSITG